MDAEPVWVCAHLFHQGDLDALMVDAVGPVVDDVLAAEQADRWFFLRHWDGGLHVRLRVRCVPATQRRVRALIAERCGRYLDAHPSEHRLTEAQYAESAAKLARIEGGTSVLDLGAPDAIAFLPYERAQAGYDLGPAGDALEAHFTECSRLTLRALRSRPAPAHRDTAALAQLLLGWFTAQPVLSRLAPLVAGDASPPDPPRGSPGLWRAAVDRRYQAQRGQLSGIAARMHALATQAPDQAAPPGGLFLDWLASLRRLRAALLDTGGADADVLPVLDRCAHLACNRAGISLTEEGYLRVLAARTVQTLTGTRR